ncbi:MAG: hypothetical protein A2161_05140 [Candidatus Schekmanbacteria bacterium RBG_13_48_7]|uniref:Uncharacterized protein n=1 Tax=Candidatus Schekmanbacteria bacterium RBG_13_48_7 TaxID=1817878 RepID=A0A1F7S1T0_9BACT|nr:MAG: hypothetical protein A2161_05140 [Candidatus Schekmanbacteria bacterium RBG_13_48_7]
MAVKKNEILARLENSDYKAALQQVQANLNVVKSSLKETSVDLEQAIKDKTRIYKLFEDGYTTEQQKDDADFRIEALNARIKSLEAQIASAKAAINLALANLENTYIRAPFDGVILRKDAEVGEIVAPAVIGGGLTRGAVVTMADLSTLEVEADVNEAYISQIKVNQDAEIILDAFPDERFHGKVRQIIPTADRQKATVLVKVSILDKDKRILPEMGAKVTFLDADTSLKSNENDKPQLFVNDAAIRVDNQKRYVWKVQNFRVIRKNVETGELNGFKRLIKNGISAGDVVAVSGFENLSEGTRVKIKNR